MTLELELVNAQKGRDANMEKLRELEEKCSQLEQNEKKCIFFFFSWFSHCARGFSY